MKVWNRTEPVQLADFIGVPFNHTIVDGDVGVDKVKEKLGSSLYGLEGKISKEVEPFLAEIIRARVLP